MRMIELTRELPIEGPDLPGIEVRGITHDSRRVEAGDLYVALVGERFDGREFVVQAVERGAVAVLGPGPAPGDITVPWLSASDPRSLLGPLARRLYGEPDRELLHVGVTGTNGKSTFVAVMAGILEQAGYPTGRIGTLGYAYRDLRYPAPRTTPEATDYFRLLREMRDRGAEAVVSEVTSHALAQGRVAAATFDLAVFTNLTRDHLDYHGDLESYFAAKRILFDLVEPQRAVVNIGDPWGARLKEEIPQAIGYGPGGEVEVASVSLGLEGTRGVIRTPRGDLDFATQLIGRYNVANTLAAVAGAEALELPHEVVRRGLAAIPVLRGRLERVEAPGPVPALVDFAHTDDALRAVLESVRELTDRRLIVVFGCGGDRDRSKRAPMGRIAGELADLAILTSDNPRSEDPAEIIRQVAEGLAESGNESYRVQPDRQAAIRLAVEEADEASIVVVAGKGHESVQILGDVEVPFSDHEEVRAALEERFGSSQAG
jgi:UDP-N-acetylmuramoyl-L-alanyl-D-glutamate--2,6-diaminopimelate ligase